MIFRDNAAEVLSALAKTEANLRPIEEHRAEVIIKAVGFQPITNEKDFSRDLGIMKNAVDVIYSRTINLTQDLESDTVSMKTLALRICRLIDKHESSTFGLLNMLENERKI